MNNDKKLFDLLVKTLDDKGFKFYSDYESGYISIEFKPKGNRIRYVEFMFENDVLEDINTHYAKLEPQDPKGINYAKRV